MVALLLRLPRRCLLIYFATIFAMVVSSAVEKFHRRMDNLLTDPSISFNDAVQNLSDYQRHLVSIHELKLPIFHAQLTALLPRVRKCETKASKTRIPIEYSNWMRNVKSEEYLHELTLPGTHDSGAYAFNLEFNKADPQFHQIVSKIYLPESIVASFACKFALTQTLDLKNQLKSGIRYFDLRIDFDPNTQTFRMHHMLLGEDAISACL